jgi:cell division protein FtsN
VERTATHDTEYVDIVLGYHHILLFSVVFGLLIFGSGYFMGYYRARSDRPDNGGAAAATANPQPSSPAAPLPQVQIPAMLTQPAAPPAGDVVKEMERLSTGALGTEAPLNSDPAASSATPRESAPAATPPSVEAPSPAATAPRPVAPSEKPAAAPAAEAPKNERQPPANGKSTQPAAPPVPRAAAEPRHARGNIYLQVSTFSAPQEAEQLINDLASEGFRALIDGQLVEGRHTVLVGPFSDFKSAAGQAKVLKEHNREAFPIRR